MMKFLGRWKHEHATVCSSASMNMNFRGSFEKLFAYAYAQAAHACVQIKTHRISYSRLTEVMVAYLLSAEVLGPPELRCLVRVALGSVLIICGCSVPLEQAQQGQ